MKLQYRYGSYQIIYDSTMAKSLQKYYVGKELFEYQLVNQTLAIGLSGFLFWYREWYLE